MSVPDYQEFMLPLLRIIQRDGPLPSNDYYRVVADDCGLTDEDRQVMLPSGTQATYKNRIGWAGTYLVKAGLGVTDVETYKVQRIDLAYFGED